MAENHPHWLRKENTDQTKASFPELFFDLVFVFALIQLSETLSDDFSFGIAVEAVLFIFALWWVWIHTTWVMDLLDTEIEPVRLLLFTLMFCGIVMAIALPEAFKGMGLVFAVAYSAMQVSRSLFALYAFRRGDPASFMAFFRITAWLTISSTFWITEACRNRMCASSCGSWRSLWNIQVRRSATGCHLSERRRGKPLISTGNT